MGGCKCYNDVNDLKQLLLIITHPHTFPCITQVYSGHCRDLTDARSVQALVKDLARYSVLVGEVRNI